MSTPTPTDPREEEIKHLRAGCEQWRKIANVADAELAEMIANRKELESTNAKLAAEIAELKAARDEANESVTLNYNTILELRRIITEIKAEFDICRSALGIQIHEKIPEQTPKFGSILVDSVGSRRRIAPATENEEKMANELATLRAELEAARKERDEAKAQFQKARELKEKYFWELGQIEVSIDGEGKIEGTGWSVAHKKVLELISIRDEANAFTKHVGGPTFKDSVDVILRTKSQDEDKIAEMFDIIKRTGADLDTALAAKDAAEKRVVELEADAEHFHEVRDEFRDKLEMLRDELRVTRKSRDEAIASMEKACLEASETIAILESRIKELETLIKEGKRTKDRVVELEASLDELSSVVGLTAFKHEGQRAVLQEAFDNARALLANRPISTEKKGGDEPCAPPTQETQDSASASTLQSTSAASAVTAGASNSPADVPSEGRGEWMPFNLADALAGKPVVTRDGRRVNKLKVGEVMIDVWTANAAFTVWKDGNYHTVGEHPLDLFMLPTEGSVA